jgi:alkylated DNA repair dioxygenase AlkB
MDVLQSIILNNKPSREATDAALKQINELDIRSDLKDQLKADLSDVIELSLRRKLFLQEHADITKNPLNYEYNPEFEFGESEELDVKVEQQEKVKGKRKPLITEKELEVNKEYSLKEPLRKEGSTLQLAPKITVLSQTLGGEFEVRLPNGQIKFLTPTEFKEYNISDEDNTSEEMGDILDKAIDTVLDKEEYADYKDQLEIAGAENVFSKREFINDLDDQKLIDAIEKEFNAKTKDLLAQREKERIAKEKLAATKETLDKELEKLAPTGGSVETVNIVAGEIIGTEDKRPDVSIVFLKTISPSEEEKNKETNNIPHIKRARTFLNNLKFFKNRNKIKAIIVTPNNAEALGLKGIVQLSNNKLEFNEDGSVIDNLTKEETDVEMGFMAQVFITQTAEGDFFVNEKGEKLSKIGPGNPTILNDVVFQTMTSASLTTEGGYTKIRKGQEEKAEIALEAYKIFRADVFAQEGYTPYSFSISRGIPNQIVVNGVYEDNHMSDILGPNAEKIIAEHNGLIEVVTTGQVENNAELLSFNEGTALIRFGDLLDFANNKVLTNKQAQNVFAVIDAMAKDLIAKSSTAKAGRPDYGYITFLKNVLYFKFKGNPTTPSQISLDTKTMEFRIGDKSFDLFKIADNKQAITNALQDAFISVNNKTLAEGTSKKFTEYVTDKDGNLTKVVWTNYQSFLLSGKNPDGSKRSTGETPLITHTAKPTDNLNSYKQKYAFITDTGVLPYDRVPVKEVKPAPVATTPGVKKIGKYEVNNGKEETLEVGSGPVLFTATLSPEGVIDVDMKDNDTIEALSTNQGKLNEFEQKLTSGASKEYKDAYEKLSNEEQVKLFLSTAIKQMLEKEYATQLEAPVVEEVVQPIAPPEVVAQQDVEAKKADIENNDFVIKIKKIGQSYAGGKQFVNTKQTGKEFLEQVNYEMYGEKVQAEHLLYFKDKFDGALYDLINRGYKELTGKTFEEYDAELAALEGGEETNIGKEITAVAPFNKGTITGKIISVTENKAKKGLYSITLDNGERVSGSFEDNKFTWIQNEDTPSEKPYDPSKLKGRDDAPEFRMVGAADVSDRMTNAELEIFKQWHAEKVPFIPFEVLERMVNVNDTEEAWGVFENGVAKFVRGGLRGTEYHEIGHGIWTMLSTEEQEALLNEFRSKPGTFTDRQSGKKIEHIDATDTQAEERIWDDFSDFRLGKLPARSLGERVRRLFKMVMDFFKSFGSKPSLKDELFEAIEAGRFKETKLSKRAKTMAPKYRAIEGLTEEQTNNYINDMVVQASRIIFREGNKDVLFNPEKLTGSQVFDKVREDYESRGAITALGEKRYNELVKRTIDSIRTRGISFNAEEVVSINDENANGKEYAQDTFSVDWKKHSTGALKFLLSTLAERKALNQNNVQKGTPLKPAEFNFSKEGYKVLNFNRVFATLLDRLHGTNDPAEFTEKFIQLAKEDSNYLPLFVSLGGNPVTHTFDFADPNKFKESDWKLFIQFFNTFTRQKPDALIQYISEEGDVYTGSANIFTTVKATVDSWVDNMKVIGKGPGGLISYDKANKVYKIDTTLKTGIKSLPTKQYQDMLSFLGKIGVEFPIGTYQALTNREIIVKGETTTEIKEFNKAVAQIKAYLGKNNELMTFDAKKLDIGGPLRTLAGLYTRVNNPNQDSTYFGVEGQRIGSFSENNAPSYFENTFNESKTLTELLEKMPQLNDVYSRGSEILKPGGLFFNKDGERIATISVGYIQGSKNELTGKDKSTAKLAKGERFVQEMNQNINGNYYVLIPGDSSTEWMMNLGNVISMDDVMSGDHWGKVYSIYSNYLTDDINLALENRKQNIYQRARSQELRIMRDILPQNIVEDIEEMIENINLNFEDYTYDDIQDYISANKKEIDASVKSFIEGTSEGTFDTLINSNQIRMVGENKYSLDKFDTEFLKKYNLNGQVSLDEVMNLINFTNINYAINNQEYHKILFGDPYQFKTEKGKLDETKRIKSFLSGRRRTFDHPDYNNFLKTTYNNVDGVELDDKTPGYHEYKEYANTITFDDVEIVGSTVNINTDYAKVNETDAMSWLMDATHKEIALKEGQWSDEAEAFHQWHMAYTRRAFDKKGIKAYTSEQLKAKDAKLLESPIPKHKLAVRKPIISGNKNNKTELDIVLDKTSQMPLYYHMVEDTSLGTIYEQMFDQNIGYGIVISGRKVGSEGNHNIYVDGKVNTAKFENIVEVPWKIYGTQVETMSEGEKTQTRGSQPTKVATMDLYENGEPIGDTPERKEVIRKAVKRHDGTLDMLNENAYNELLNRLGVVDLGDTYALENNQIISETLMYEMMRRDLSENAKDTIQLDENGEFPIPFEASPSYIQIKNILYSMVNKALISPAMSGAPHVQAPVTMFEQATEGRSFARKIDNKWVKITKAQYKALTEEEKKGVMLTDDTLKFYEDKDGKRYCEVLLPHWFKNKFGKMTDDQILKYLDTDEGRKILTGIGFRIPTQALSSMEVFKVKGFLPQYMGYTVIVPSEITTKAGSDFDIDKLNMYLKSIYTDKNGNVKLVKWLGTEQATKDFFTKVYDESTERKALKKAELIEAVDTLVYGLDDTKGLIKKYGEYILSIQDKYDDPFAFRAEMEKELDKLTDDNINAELRQAYINNMYKKSLENEYYDSLEELLTLPENFNRLITPVDDAGLEKIAELLDEKRGYNESNIKGRLINRNFMTNMRHAFITGKRWVGIAAVNITNLSLRQKSKVYLDPSKITSLSAREREFVEDLVGNISIVLPHNTLDVEGKTYVSLSGTRTADLKQLISQRLSGYATAFVDIANKPFITKIIKSDTVVSTFMFLEAIGAGNTGIYFLNQPIIEKYLEYLDSIGSKSVMGKDNLSYIRDQFPTTEKAMRDARISVDQLLDNIQEYSEKGEFDQRKNAEQQLILNEFIKYKILADQLFSYTQSTNYDTTRFGSSDALLKKEWATFNTSNFNLISNVDEVLANTFIGKQAELLSKSFASFGAIMKTELPEIKAYTIATLKKYATRKYMSSDDYEKIANLIKNSFVDYVIQNNTTISNMVEPLLVNSETAVVNQLEQAKQKYPNMQILKDLIPVLGNRDGSAKSIQLKANVKDAYSENLYVGMMREMRDIPELNNLYNNIVNVAILQGVGQSAISIRNIIPVEDYAAKIAPIIQQLTPNPTLDAFENGMFERNNFTNKDVITDFTPYVYTPEPDENGQYNELSIRTNPNTGEDELVHFLPAFTSMKGVSKTSRRLLMLSDRFNSFQLSSDFLRIPKVITDKNSDDGKKVNVMTGIEVTKADYAKMKQKGSQDLYDSYYYKKVYTTNKDKFGNPIPLTTIGATKQGDPLTNYYYKLINVYGDGNRAVEFNKEFGPSVIDNGSMRIKQELNDQDIVNQFASQIAEEVVSLPTEEEIVAPTQMIGKPKGVEVKEGIYVNQEALSKDEQLELFDYLKPFLEEQAAKTNKGEAASKMIGLGLRWDYKSNNPGKQAMNIPDVINPGNKTKYGYYDSSINNQPLAPITPRFRELMQKATGVDMTNYDGAIINLYEPNSFISSHNDVDESRSAIGYPVIGINIGGTGNFSIESRDGAPKQLNLKAGAGYVFGVDGVNREVYHRTFAKPQDSFLPELTTKLDGKAYEPGSYRVTVTMRRVLPLELGMPSKPTIISTETISEKPEGITQEEWDGLSQEEKNKINEC